MMDTNKTKGNPRVRSLFPNLVIAKIEESKAYIKDYIQTKMDAKMALADVELLVHFFDIILDTLQKDIASGNILFEPFYNSVKGIVAGLNDVQKSAMVELLSTKLEDLESSVPQAAVNVFRGLFVNDQMMQFALGLKKLCKKYNIQDVKNLFKSIQRGAIDYFYFQRNHGWNREKLFEPFLKEPVEELMKERDLPAEFKNYLVEILDRPEFPLVDFSSENLIIQNEVFERGENDQDMVLYLKILQDEKNKELILLDPMKESSQLVLEIAKVLESEFGKGFIEIKEMQGYFAIIFDHRYLVGNLKPYELKKSGLKDVKTVAACLIQNGY